jgi:hypothetical protein
LKRVNYPTRRLDDRFWHRVRELRTEVVNNGTIATTLGVGERAGTAGRRKLGIG